MGAERIKSVLEDSAKVLLEQQNEVGWWSFPAYLGSHYVALYALFRDWLGERSTPGTHLDREKLVRRLVETQLMDGSWQQARDPALGAGELNTTVLNYAFLKVSEARSGTSAGRVSLGAARKFILQAGGLGATNQFTKTFLALFGWMEWKEIQAVPYAVFWEGVPMNYRGFAQWVVPHLLPIAYLRHNRVSRCVCAGVGLEELELEAKGPVVHSNLKPSVWYDGPIVEKLVRKQCRQGSWGGYTVSTLLSIAVLEHFEQVHPGRIAHLRASVARGLSFVEALCFESGEGAYRGCLMHGEIWDSILTAQTLLATGAPAEPLLRAGHCFCKVQTSGGGIPYGQDFDAAPDVDDTSRAIVFLEGLARATRQPAGGEARQRAVQWLLKWQNADGGWGAFDKDNVGHRVTRFFTRHLSDSVELFDSSSADNTGHALQALGASGVSFSSPVATAAATFLRRMQDPQTGLWQGRWGINTLYGTAQAGLGLLRIGESPRSRCLSRAVSTLFRLQNCDGGFGETTLSYRNPDYWGRGVSTASQTAWVVEFLVAMGLAQSPVVARAVAYLLETWTPTDLWKDEAVVGTGHPGILYVEYPVYAKTFPLMALARFLRATS